MNNVMLKIAVPHPLTKSGGGETDKHPDCVHITTTLSPHHKLVALRANREHSGESVSRHFCSEASVGISMRLSLQ